MEINLISIRQWDYVFYPDNPLNIVDIGYYSFIDGVADYETEGTNLLLINKRTATNLSIIVRFSSSFFYFSHLLQLHSLKKPVKQKIQKT